MKYNSAEGGYAVNPHVGKPLSILFLSARSGGGHDGVAKALETLFSRQLLTEVKIIDLYESKSLKVFPFLARIRAISDTIWRTIYRMTDNPDVVRRVWSIFKPMVLKTLRQQIFEQNNIEQPDLIISVHHGSSQCLEAIADDFGKRPKTCVFVTDYEAHANWLAPAGLYVVASDLAYKQAKEYGSNVYQIPMLPCRKSAVVQPKTLNPDQQDYHIMVLMGLDGTSYKKLTKILELLDHSSISINLRLHIFCGNNKKLFRSISNLKFNQLSISLYGFVKDIDQRLASADLALMRLSPQTMTESLAAATPVIGFDWHAHEGENVNVLKQFGCGDGFLSEQKVVDQILSFCSDPELRELWNNKAYQASQRACNEELVFKLIEMLDIPTLPEIEQSAVA